MIGIELINKDTGELSYYEVTKLGVQGNRIRVKLKNESIRTFSTKTFILTTKENK